MGGWEEKRGREDFKDLPRKFNHSSLVTCKWSNTNQIVLDSVPLSHGKEILEILY